VAVTFWAWLIVTWQVPVPLQAPLQPPNVEPPVGVGVRVTTVLKAKLALQVPLALPAVRVQSMPLGLEITVPVPVPVPATVSCRGVTVNWGRITWSKSGTTITQGLKVPHGDPQPPKLDPEAGWAVRVTDVPGSNQSEQIPVCLPAL
jgi:hypothetical protein